MSSSHVRVYIDSAHKPSVRYIFFQSGSGVFTFILVSSEDQVPPLASMIFLLPLLFSFLCFFLIALPFQILVLTELIFE